MKKSEIRPALEVLRAIRMPKIEDKALRNTLIENHFVLLAEGRKLDASIEDRRAALLGPYEKEEQEVQQLQRRYQAATDPKEAAELGEKIDSHKEYFDAIRLYNDFLKGTLNEDVGGLKPVDRTAFMTAAIDQPEFSLSWIEGLFPLFEIE